MTSIDYADVDNLRPAAMAPERISNRPAAMAAGGKECAVTTEDPVARPSVVAPPAVEIADPGPLGLAAFAMTTFVLSVFNTNILSVGVTVILGLALAYGGITQLLAGMWEFRKGNTFGATAFASYGAFWISFWVILNTPTVTAKGVGWYLLAWCIFTAYMTVASLRTSGAVAAVFVFLTFTFLFLSIGKFGGNANMTKIGGWLGFVTAILAWYASFAGVTNATWKKTILPVFPLAR